MARTGAVRRTGGAAVRGNERSRSGGGSVRPPYGPGPSPDGEPTPSVHHVESPVTPRITGETPSRQLVSSASGAPARTDRPRYRSVRPWPARTQGTRP